jgi:hypothetical protein
MTNQNQTGAESVARLMHALLEVACSDLLKVARGEAQSWEHEHLSELITAFDGCLVMTLAAAPEGPRLRLIEEIKLTLGKRVADMAVDMRKDGSDLAMALQPLSDQVRAVDEKQKREEEAA